MKQPTIAVDFDGGRYRYSKGWHDGTAYDNPMPGALSALGLLLNQGYSVYVFTTRDLGQVAEWFAEHAKGYLVERVPEDALFWEKTGVIGLSNRKIVAYVWIDDRALRFESWQQTLKDLERLLP